MKERSLIMCPYEIRATLDGRQTQIRRVITKWTGPELPAGNEANQEGYQYVADSTIKRAPWTPELIKKLVACPYGVPGDRLYVKETWDCNKVHVAGFDSDGPGEGWTYDREAVRYRADGEPDFEIIWRPSIHMPRWASRITLEVVNVRVERLQDISEKDARAEGVALMKDKIKSHATPQVHYCWLADTAREGYELLWNSINGKKYPWSDNPWVRAVEFKRINS